MSGERFYYLAEHENEHKSAVGNSWSRGTDLREPISRGPVSPTRTHVPKKGLNFWLCKFICEVAKQTWGRYPPKTLDLLVCDIKRHLANVQGKMAFNTYWTKVDGVSKNTG